MKRIKVDPRLSVTLKGRAYERTHQSCVFAGSGPPTATSASVHKLDLFGIGAAPFKLSLRDEDLELDEDQEPKEGFRYWTDPVTGIFRHDRDRRLTLKKLLERAARYREKYEGQLAVYANICWGYEPDNWVEAVEAIANAEANGVKLFDGIEFNVSCPTTSVDGRMIFGICGETHLPAEIIGKARELTDIFFIYKIVEKGQDLEEQMVSCEQAGADCVHGIGNPTIGEFIKGPEGRYLVRGGDCQTDPETSEYTVPVSGRAVINGSICYPDTLKMTQTLAEIRHRRGLNTLITVSGGVHDGYKAFECVEKGADTVALCSALIPAMKYGGKWIIPRMHRQLLYAMEAKGYTNIEQVRQKARERLAG